MNNAGISLDKVKQDFMKDDAFKAEYEKLRPRYEMIEQIIAARNEKHMSQRELAQRIGTSKSNISRLESGNYNPSLDMLTKVASALGKDLNISLS